MKGAQATNRLDTKDATKLMELHHDDLEFEVRLGPYYYFKIQYPIRSVHPDDVYQSIQQ